jgi:GH24 family phage-related lysozyme (muramidase)
MGGKSSTSSQSVSIPPEVLARYNSVNARAEEVAKTPFQPYTDQFVAGLTPTQTAGIQNTSASATQAQPYYNAATGLTLSGAQDVGALKKNQIGYYQNPYTQAVAAPTYAALQQQQGQERSQQQAQAIKSGAAFGERSGLQRAQLAGQQGLATAQALAPIYQQGYQQAVQTAQGQQGVVAADLARRMQAGQQVAGIGTAAQQAGLQGAQAQIAAGTVEQQTQQADLTAKYQQFLQQRGYDFQTAQFLANIAMGTGSLSGSTTTTTQPQGFFSDERLKHDAHRIGETDDGLPIYSFKYNGDNKTQIGLMAQDVEKRKPEAVGLAPAADGKMYKTVDYDKATRQHKDYGGGVMGGYDPSSMGGAVAPGLAGEGFADGGMPGMPNMGGMPGVTGYVPAANLPIGKLMIADSKLLQQNKAGLGSAVETGKNIAGLYDMGKSGVAWGKKQIAANGGLIVPRHGYATAGGVGDDEPTPYNYDETKAGEDPMKDVLQSGSLISKSLQKPGVGGAPGQGRGIGNDIMDAANLAKGVGGLYSAGSSFMKFLPTILPFADGGRTPFAYGGLIPRQHHADGERVIADGEPVVSADGGDGDAPSLDNNPTLRLISKFEGFREKPYYDVNALRAGFGSDTVTMPDGTVRRVDADTRVSMDDAKRDLARRTNEFQSHIRGAVGDDAWSNLDPNSQAALTSVTYNYGRLPKSVVEAAQSGDKKSIAAAVNALGVHNEGVNARRRSEEASLIDPEGKYAAMSGAPRPPGVVGRSERTPSTYSGKGAGEASFGDVVSEYLPQGTPTSANFWVPALAGLGSMLASKNPTLLGAVGEGLVGGVGGYQAQQKQQQEAAKQIFDLVKGRFTQSIDESGNVIFRDNMMGTLVSPGQVQSSVSKMLTSAGIDPSAYGLGRVQTADATGLVPPSKEKQPATLPETKPTVQPETKTQVQALPTKPREEWNLGDYRKDAFANPADYGFTPGSKDDPNVLFAEIQRERRAAQLANAQGLEANARMYNTSAQEKEKILNDRIKDATDLAYRKTTKMQESTLASADKWENDAGKFLANYDQSKDQLMEISRLQALGMQTGYSADTRAKLGSFLKLTFGVDLSDKLGDPTYYNYAAKIAAETVRDQIAARNLGRAPASMSSLLQKSSPDPNIDTGAVHLLLGQALGELEHTKARDMEYLSKYRGQNPNVFLKDYNSDPKNKDSYNRALAGAYSELYVPEKDPTVGKLVRDLNEKYGKYGYTPRQLSDERAAQSLPVIRSLEDARKLPSGSVFVDPNGIQRRVP